jgi:hypothetical protein
VGSAVEWAFEADRLAELRTVSNQTGGRELLDLSKAWLRPPFVAETSLHLPLGIAVLLLVLIEALLTRTDWKLPQFNRSPRPAAVAKARRVRRPVKIIEPEPIVKVVHPEVNKPNAPTEATEQGSRFQRAKKRK